MHSPVKKQLGTGKFVPQLKGSDVKHVLLKVEAVSCLAKYAFTSQCLLFFFFLPSGYSLGGSSA